MDEEHHKRPRLEEGEQDLALAEAPDGSLYVTTSDTIRAWRWHKRGGAKLLASGTLRQYYNCSQQKVTGCPAR